MSNGSSNTVAYEFSQDSKVYADCTFNSRVVGSITAGEILLITEVAGGWYKSDLGWLWGWAADMKAPIVKKMSSESTNLSVGTTRTDIREVC